jgi:ribosomal protein S18 acetylase RimI-like enzyme
LRALADAPDAFGSTLADAEARSLDDWQAQVASMPTFVAVAAGLDVGMVRGAADGDTPTVLWLLSMWVAPEARGRGVGSSLIDALLAWAEPGAFERVVLDVADGNAAAVALYARKGFEPTGEVGSLPPPREHVREHRRALALR